MELAERMRFENREQFSTLVRMHLSFELDLNTDENELVVPERGKLKKRFNFNKKTKSCTSAKSVSSPGISSLILTKHGITQMKQLIEFLMQEQSVVQEGIFRRTGSLVRQNDLRNKINGNQTINFATALYTVHDCASVFKGILADLPEPLLTDLYYPAHCQIAGLCSSNCAVSTQISTKETRLLHSIQLLILLLPMENQLLFKEIIEMLHYTTKFEKFNKMSADSLATLFTPHLICPRKLPPEALHATCQKMSTLISYMINKGTSLFDVPPKLSTDIRVYFMDQKRKRTKSPENILNDSVASDSVANTVYTFVDREKTAEAHTTNPTDTALAQLYAHIQCLPESSKKRKLIKQFNKENGQGTPLQLQMLHRQKQISPMGSNKAGSRSIGDSIKRHIFHKGIMSRTTKNSAVTPSTSTRAFDTPNSKSSRNILSETNAKQQLIETPTIQSKTIRKSVSASCLNESRLSGEFVEKKPNDTTRSSLETSTIERNTDESIVMNRNHLQLLRSRFQSEPNLGSISINDDVDYSVKENIVDDSSNATNQWFELRLAKQLSFDNSITVSNDSDSKVSIENISFEACDESILDDPDFEATSYSHRELSSHDVSTDELTGFAGRNSMSPITKSTQRMSKAMQESIMTPRSRKPVMLLGAVLGSSDQILYQNSFSSLPEEEEEEDNQNDIDLKDRHFNIRSNQPVAVVMRRSKSEGDFAAILSTKTKKSENEYNSTALTPAFSRNVHTSSPVDSSFSSHPDDFASTSEDIEMPSENDMSESFLFVMNGNKPFNNRSLQSTSELSDSVQDNEQINSNLHLKYSSKRSNDIVNEDQTFWFNEHPTKVLKPLNEAAEPGHTCL